MAHLIRLYTITRFGVRVWKQLRDVWGHLGCVQDPGGAPALDAVYVWIRLS